MRLHFSKVHGAGNDYVVVNTADGTEDWPAVARALCRSRLGVGADGLVVITHHGGAGFAVRCLNPDGSESSVSGNALRCCALAIAGRYGYRSCRLRMGGEDHQTVVGPGGIGVAFRCFGPVCGPSRSAGLAVHTVPVGGQAGDVQAVVFVRALDQLDVPSLGARVRQDRQFGDGGVNVAFAERVGPALLRLRCYERGVERETLSSGAGAVGAALVGWRLGLLAPRPVSVHTQGGALTVSAESPPAAAEPALRGLPEQRALPEQPSLPALRGLPEQPELPGQVWLHGPATLVFDGELDWPGQAGQLGAPDPAGLLASPDPGGLGTALGSGGLGSGGQLAPRGAAGLLGLPGPRGG